MNPALASFSFGPGMIGALSLVILLLSGCATVDPSRSDALSARDPAAPGAGSGDEGASAPARLQVQDFELDTLLGDRVRLGELVEHRRVVLISFWATWCEPCKLELPHLSRLQEKYRDRGLTVLAIAIDGPSTMSEVRAFVRRHRVRLTVPLDLDRRVTTLLNPKVMMPFWLLIDRQGRLVRTHQGYLPGDEEHIEAAVLEALGE